MPYNPTLADLAAITDLLQDAINATTELDLAGCVDWRIGADAVRAKAKELMDYCDMQMIQVAEGRTVVRDGVLYEVGDAGHWKFDHDLVRDVVARIASTPDENGEVGTAREVAAKAAALMAEVYVSPSSTAKVTSLSAAGVEVPAVRDWVDESRRKVKATPVAKLTKKRRAELGIEDQR